MWSFDDYAIGKRNPKGRTLDARYINRPKGLTTNEWYFHASVVCKVLNEISDDTNS